MRLKEDRSSYKANCIENKEFRGTPIENETTKTKSKKNTKKWCKGKVGVEHNWMLMVTKNSSHLKYRSNVCEKCGRIKDKYSEWLCSRCNQWVSMWQHECINLEGKKDEVQNN